MPTALAPFGRPAAAALLGALAAAACITPARPPAAAPGPRPDPPPPNASMPNAPSVAAPTPAALRAHVVPGALRPGVDSFAVVAGGAARGWQRVTVARDGAGWRLSDAVAFGAAVRQESRVRLTADLAEVELRQEGQVGPAAMAIALDWTRTPAGDRVRGTARTPDREASAPLAIDAVVPAGTVDDNAVLALLPALRWGGALDVAFPVLASGKGTVSTYRVRVLAADSAAVPAGRFATWRAEMAGGGTTVVLHVTRAVPHRVVRALPAGMPFELQRVR